MSSTLAKHASADTFVSFVGVFPIERITLGMLRALDSANDYGHIRCGTATFNRLHALGLAERRGLNDRITHAGWNVAALFPLPEVYDPQQRPERAHTTRTWQNSLEPVYRMRPNGRDTIKPDSASSWACSCGARGSGEDRAHAQRRARQHRVEHGES